MESPFEGPLASGLSPVSDMGGVGLADYQRGTGFTPALVADFENGVYFGTISSFDDFTSSGTSFDTAVGARRLLIDPATDSLTLPYGKIPLPDTGWCYSLIGNVTYADNDDASEVFFLHWYRDGGNYIYGRLQTHASRTGYVEVSQRESVSGFDHVSSPGNVLEPGTNVPFGLAARHGDTFINVAEDGTTFTANLTPTALFTALGTNDLNIIYSAAAGNTVRLKELIIWDKDIGDAGITSASALG